MNTSNSGPGSTTDAAASKAHPFGSLVTATMAIIGFYLKEARHFKKSAAAIALEALRVVFRYDNPSGPPPTADAEQVATHAFEAEFGQISKARADLESAEKYYRDAEQKVAERHREVHATPRIITREGGPVSQLATGDLLLGCVLALAFAAITLFGFFNTANLSLPM